MKLQIKQAKILTRALPFFVWFCALIIVVLMFLQKSAAVELKGVVFSHEQIINTTETGYLRSIPVTLYQEVKKGDTLAIVKENTIAREEYIDTLLQAQRETAEAELERLKAELVAAENRLLLTDTERENETMAIERRLAVDLERARLEVLEITATLEPDRLTLKDLEVENEIVQKLVNEQAAEIYELKKVQTQYDILKEKVDRTEHLLTQAQNAYQDAQLRKDQFEQSNPVSPYFSDRELAPTRKAILVQEKRLAELIKQRGIIVLTAPFDGIVNTLDYKAGQTVVRGDAIMTLVKPVPESIKTWVSQKSMSRFSINTKVEIVSLDSPQQRFVSQISHMSPSLELIPQRLWRSPTIPEWGRSILIPIHPDFTCVHNEVVGIRTILQ